MANVKFGIGLVGIVAVAFANVATSWAQSDELPRRLRERISRTVVDGGFPSVAAGFDSEKKITASDGAAGDRFGISVAISGDTAIVGAVPPLVLSPGRSAAYVYQRNEAGAGNWGMVTKITVSDESTNDQFGFSVAISGDTAIVGARVDDVDGTKNAGSAYVYQRDEGGVNNWGQVTKITASDAAVFDNFGVSVAISGDTAIVGAKADDDNGGNSGSAYVYQRDEGGVDNWGLVTKITASDGAFGDEFGISVAISSDTAIVGAWISGSAYVYQRDEGGADNWGEVAKITASDGVFFPHEFGISVALSGDTAIVGARSDDDNGSLSGSAYVYQRDEGGVDNWGEVTKITASDGAGGDPFGDLFGHRVAISGDTAIVGAVGDDDDGDGSGSAYVYRRDEGGADNWGEVTKITASDAAGGDSFGNSVAISGDTAIVGAALDNDNGAGSGSAYVFERKPAAVPTVAEWGIMAMTLLLLTMTITFGYRRRLTR